MLGQVIAMVASAFGAANDWWLRFQISIPGSNAFFLAGVFVFVVVTKLLGPIIGGRGSDQVKKSKNKKKDG